MPLFLFSNTQTMHIKTIVHYSIAMASLKSLYPGGIQNRVTCFSGKCDVHCAKPPGQHTQLLKFRWMYLMLNRGSTPKANSRFCLL
jgi:hypothetical protein